MPFYSFYNKRCPCESTTFECFQPSLCELAPSNYGNICRTSIRWSLSLHVDLLGILYASGNIPRSSRNTILKNLLTVFKWGGRKSTTQGRHRVTPRMHREVYLQLKRCFPDFYPFPYSRSWKLHVVQFSKSIDKTPWWKGGGRQRGPNNLHWYEKKLFRLRFFENELLELFYHACLLSSESVLSFLSDPNS